MLHRARPLVLSLACLLIVVATQSGCLSFRSVVAAGSVGQLVGQRSLSIKMMPFFCDAQNILASPEQTCPRDKIQTYVTEITTYSQSVAKYAAALKRLAEFNDETFGDELSDAIQGIDRVNQAVSLKEESTPSIASAARNLGAVLTQEWRRNKMEQLIIASHPHLMLVLDGLQSRTALLAESIKGMAEQDLELRRRGLAEVDRVHPRPASRKGHGRGASHAAPADPEAPASDVAGRMQRQSMQLSLLHFAWFTQQGYDNFVNYQKALIAFKQAHLILFKSVTTARSLSDDDKEIYDLLQKDLPGILK